MVLRPSEMTAGDVMRATKGAARPVSMVEPIVDGASQQEPTVFADASTTPAKPAIAHPDHGSTVATMLPSPPRVFMQAPLPEGRGSSINFRLTREMHQRLKAASFSTGMKIQAIMERAVTKELDEMGF